MPQNIESFFHGRIQNEMMGHLKNKKRYESLTAGFSITATAYWILWRQEKQKRRKNQCPGLIKIMITACVLQMKLNRAVLNYIDGNVSFFFAGNNIRRFTEQHLAAISQEIQSVYSRFEFPRAKHSRVMRPVTYPVSC